MSSPSSRRALLKEATHDLHRDLDADVSRLNLQRVDDYRNYLHAHAGPLIALELALEAGGIESVLPDWAERRRRNILQLDLECLDARVPASSEIPILTDASAQFGTLYVLEGSRLGARFLLQCALASADSEIRSACRFLSANDPKLWLGFLRVLETSAAPIDNDRMVNAAREAFELFARSFSSVIPARRQPIDV